jgi:hypothetical protein
MAQNNMHLLCHFPWVRTTGTALLGSLLRMSHKAEIKISASAEFSSGNQLLPSSLVLLEEFNLLQL